MNRFTFAVLADSVQLGTLVGAAMALLVVIAFTLQDLLGCCEAILSALQVAQLTSPYDHPVVRHPPSATAQEAPGEVRQ